MKDFKLKPNKNVFITYRFFLSLIYYFIAFGVVGFVVNKLTNLSFIYVIIFIILISVIRLLSLIVQYKKTFYLFKSDRILCEKGGIFSNKETELILRNITHVKLTIPWIENKLYSTGYISIGSAGAGSRTEFLGFLDSPQKVFDIIKQMMRANGFKLKENNLLREDKPVKLAVILDTLTFTLSSLFIFYYLSFMFLISSSKIMRSILLIISFIVVFLIILLRYNDLINRKYKIYSDIIVYSEGFLTKHYSFMPVENLSDSVITQGILGKILGLYNIKISSQGSYQAVNFKNLSTGKEIDSILDSLIKSSNTLIGTKIDVKQKSSINTTNNIHALKQNSKLSTIKPFIPSKKSFSTKFEANFKMDGSRSFFWIIILLLMILISSLFSVYFLFLIFPWLFLVLIVGIDVKFTDYSIKTDSMVSISRFLSLKKKEFTNDKITGFIFKEDIIDKLLNTFSLTIWSIGSADIITFKNIKKEDGLYQQILFKLGISSQNELYYLKSKFSFFKMFLANFHIFFLSLLFFTFGIFVYKNFSLSLNNVLFIITIIFLSYIIIYLYNIIYYSDVKLVFYKDYLYYQKGWLLKRYYYVNYDDIKDIKTIKYPFSDVGSIVFDVAGEHLERNRNNRSPQTVSNTFMINYISDISIKDELIDLLFYYRPNKNKLLSMEKNISDYSNDVVLNVKPDVANSILRTILFSVVLFPLIVLLPISLPLVIWSMKVKKYVIQSYRVYMKKGIFFKKQTSIVFNKINFINSKQDFTNKLFNNGSLTIQTSGSSSVELTLSDFKDYKLFYNKLKSIYK